MIIFKDNEICYIFKLHKGFTQGTQCHISAYSNSEQQGDHSDMSHLDLWILAWMSKDAVNGNYIKEYCGSCAPVLVVRAGWNQAVQTGSCISRASQGPTNARVCGAAVILPLPHFSWPPWANARVLLKGS